MIRGRPRPYSATNSPARDHQRDGPVDVGLLPSRFHVLDYDPGMRAMYMRRCLELAEIAALAGDTAVGALIVSGDEIVGEGVERTRATRDPSAHAEVEAIRQACRR